MKSCCVLQFAKLPELSKVKTRMQPHLSVEESLALHVDLTRHTYVQLAEGSDWDYELWVGGRGTSPDFFDQLQAFHSSKIHVQKGGDLGERMAHALDDVLSRYQFAVVVGSDCPELTGERVSQLFDQLRGGVRGALIPATDGGYVALGLSRMSAVVFEGIDWGSAQVLEQTMARFEQLKWPTFVAAAMADIDRPEDLPHLCDYEWGERWVKTSVTD